VRRGGDSGGPLYAGQAALGITSGGWLDGNGRCLPGASASAFFQPAVYTLDANYASLL
jgi:hypothetical protein